MTSNYEQRSHFTQARKGVAERYPPMLMPSVISEKNRLPANMSPEFMRVCMCRSPGRLWHESKAWLLLTHGRRRFETDSCETTVM